MHTKQKGLQHYHCNPLIFLMELWGVEPNAVNLTEKPVLSLPYVFRVGAMAMPPDTYVCYFLSLLTELFWNCQLKMTNVF